MTEIKYIQSLHRPFNQNLNTAKWVCSFVNSLGNKGVPKSQFYARFYLYLIEKLSKRYNKSPSLDLTGLPSAEAISNVHAFIKANSQHEILDLIAAKVRNPSDQIDRNIYSTYKACSYYINLAKDKFKLVDENNQLTPNGRKLMSLKSNEFELSSKERYFFFQVILEVDFHLFITNCYFQKVGDKYNLSDRETDQFNFLDEYYGIGHFNFTSASLGNFNTVRNYWIKDLKVLDKNHNIRKIYGDLLISDKYIATKGDLDVKFKAYETSNLVKKRKYNTFKKQFLSSYDNCKANELGYVNLYEVKKGLNVSMENFQKYLSEFYEAERNNYSLFFNNIVHSIDKRKRFYIRNRPVLNIKIKKS